MIYQVSVDLFRLSLLMLLFSGIYVAHGLYALTPKISIGAEGIIHRGMNPTLRQIATQFSGSVAAKYTSK